MSEQEYNENDPLFLLSRSLDQELSAQKRQSLDEALASSGSLRDEAAKLRGVDRLVRRWGSLEVDANLDGFAEAVGGAPEPEGLAGVDELVARWGSRSVESGSEALVARVMARIAPTPHLAARGPVAARRPLHWQRVIFRVGAPLAAAAALALAFVTYSRVPPSSHRQVEVAWGPPLAAVSQRVCDVSFRRVPAGQQGPSIASGVSFVIAGADPLPAEQSVAPPL